jgi:hypothetical protein
MHDTRLKKVPGGVTPHVIPVISDKEDEMGQQPFVKKKLGTQPSLPSSTTSMLFSFPSIKTRTIFLATLHGAMESPSRTTIGLYDARGAPWTGGVPFSLSWQSTSPLQSE